MTRLLLASLWFVSCTCASSDAVARFADRDALFLDRAEAAEVLRKEGRVSQAVDLLRKRLTDPSESRDERFHCLQLAEKLGPDGSALVPVLLQELAKEDAGVGTPYRLASAKALGSVAPADPNVFEAVEKVRPREMDFVGSQWAPVLARFGERALPIFIVWIRTEDLATRMMAAQWIGECGEAAVPHLLEALRDRQHWIALATAESLRKTGAPAAQIVPSVAAMLDGEGARAYGAALDALGKFGRDAAAAAPKIRRLLEHPEPYVQVAAAHALFRITGELDDGSVTRVGAALSSQFVPVFHRAAQALRDFGPRARPALPAVAKAMRRTTRETRAILCDAIGAMGKDAGPEGIAALRGCLRGDYDKDAPHWDDVVGHEDIGAAIRALAALDAREAVPEIRAVLGWKARPMTDEVRLLQRRASEALAKLER